METLKREAWNFKIKNEEMIYYILIINYFFLILLF